MIQSLWKTEVYDMSAYLASEMQGEQKQALTDCIDANPTDGLGITNSDLDQIGVSSYNEVDQILIKYLNGGFSTEEAKSNPVLQRHLRSEFKRHNPFNIPRDLI